MNLTGKSPKGIKTHTNFLSVTLLRSIDEIMCFCVLACFLLRVSLFLLLSLPCFLLLYLRSFVLSSFPPLYAPTRTLFLPFPFLLSLHMFHLSSLPYRLSPTQAHVLSFVHLCCVSPSPVLYFLLYSMTGSFSMFFSRIPTLFFFNPIRRFSHISVVFASNLL